MEANIGHTIALVDMMKSLTSISIALEEGFSSNLHRRKSALIGLLNPRSDFDIKIPEWMEKNY